MYIFLISDCKPGHIPGSVSVPFVTTLAPYTTPEGEEMPQAAIKSTEELKKVFESRGVDLAKPLVASCGSGNTSDKTYVF